MGVRKGGQIGHLIPLEIGIELKFSRKPETTSLILINWSGPNSCIGSWFAGMTPTLHMSQVHDSGVMLWWAKFTHIRSAPCRGRLRNLLADCSILGLYCVTIGWQQILKGSYQVAVEDVLPHVTVEHGRNFVVKCGGTAWCKTNIVIGSMRKWRFIYTDSQSYF